MNKTVVIIALMVLSVAGMGAVVGASENGQRHADRLDRSSYDDDSDDSDDSSNSESGWISSREDVVPVQNAAYEVECGSCHFTYQPGLLPEESWSRIMDSLQEHFGEDASLEDAQVDEIRRFLGANAADRSSYSRSRAFAWTGSSSASLPRITDTRYFQREHHEIPRAYVEGNADVQRFSNCLACHRTADRGIYNEHQVNIPGVGKWDD